MSYGYQDLEYSARHGLTPELNQAFFPEIAPCPIWLVPPGFRVARLSDLSNAANQTSVSPDMVEPLLQQLGIAYAPTIILMGPWKDPVGIWKIEGTEEYLVLWQTGRRRGGVQVEDVDE